MSSRILLLISMLYFVSNIYAQIPQPDHIVIVIEENKSYSQIIGSNNAPYINSLATDTLGVLFTNFYAETHPSQPNYLWLFSGDNQGVTDDNVPTDTPFTTANLGAALLDSGYSFYAYNEDMPSIGYEGAQSGNYVRKHNPMANWQYYGTPYTNGISFTKNVPFSDFPSDYTALPLVSYVIPNLQHDMHDGTIAQGDTWLQNNLDGYIQWAKTHNSLFILTWDENDGSSGNKIANIFVGQMVMQGNDNTHYNHLNLLRTIEDMYDLGYAGSSADSSAITTCWDSITPVELSTFTANEIKGNVILSWTTSTETNNNSFLIERKQVNSQFSSIATIPGNGTSTIPHSYTFTDKTVGIGEYTYRLKQVNFDGSYSYSETVNVNVTGPASFILEQNYPNPFNPETNISFSVPRESFVTLKVYDILGNEVRTLVSEKKPQGNYKVKFDASNLPSGVYFARMEADNLPDGKAGFVSVKKMVLLK
jgi:phosphatidylinositol-3-phosphatase